MSEQKKMVENSKESPLDPNQLLFVHVTRFLPNSSRNGYEMKSTYEATGLPRDTIHFTLNHPVASHMYGNWDDVPYVILTPFNDMVASNGNPIVLNTVDTFFEVGPGRRLELPESTHIVKPIEGNGLPPGVLFSSNGNETVYKKSNLEIPDWEALFSKLSDDEKYDFNNRNVRSVFVDAERYGGEISAQLRGGGIITQEEFERLYTILPMFDDPHDFTGNIVNLGLKGEIESIFTLAGIREKIPDDVIDGIQKKIEGFAIAKIKDKAISETIENMGYKVQPGGMWAWGGSWTVTTQTQKLGNEIGIPVMAHTDHITHKMTEGFTGGWGQKGLLNELKGETITREEYERQAAELIGNNAASLSPTSLRMFYDMGVI